MTYAFSASWEKAANEIGQGNYFKNEENQCADKAVRNDGEVERQYETYQEARCKEVDWSGSAEQLVDEELFAPFLHCEGN